MTEQLTPKEILRIAGILNDCFPDLGKKDRRNEATGKLVGFFETQLATIMTRLKDALEQSRKDEDIDLPEDWYGLFYSIRNSGVTKSQVVCPELSEIYHKVYAICGRYADKRKEVFNKNESFNPDSFVREIIALCQGTGKSSPDREKIARQLCSFDNKGWEDINRKTHTLFDGSLSQEAYLRRADQIIALNAKAKERLNEY